MPMLQNGDEVVRNDSFWTYGNDDGGAGNRGRVTGGSGGRVTVKWSGEGGKLRVYKYGLDDEYQVKPATESAPEAVVATCHEGDRLIAHVAGLVGVIVYMNSFSQQLQIYRSKQNPAALQALGTTANEHLAYVLVDLQQVEDMADLALWLSERLLLPDGCSVDSQGSITFAELTKLSRRPLVFTARLSLSLGKTIHVHDAQTEIYAEVKLQPSSSLAEFEQQIRLLFSNLPRHGKLPLTDSSGTTMSTDQVLT